MARARLPFLPGREDPDSGSVVVLGLGRFGGSVATELVASGSEVLGIDADLEIVQSMSGVLTHAVQADTTKEEALRQLSVPEFDRAVVGIGTDIEASILTASLLMDFGIADVWAKAVSEAHGRILRQLGVHHVVSPEADMGRRIAHQVRGQMLDFVEFEDEIAMARTDPPRDVCGRALGEARVRREYGVTVVAYRRGESAYVTADEETVLEPADTIIVVGPTDRVEHFSRKR